MYLRCACRLDDVAGVSGGHAASGQYYYSAGRLPVEPCEFVGTVEGIVGTARGKYAVVAERNKSLESFAAVAANVESAVERKRQFVATGFTGYTGGEIIVDRSVGVESSGYDTFASGLRHMRDITEHCLFLAVVIYEVAFSRTYEHMYPAAEQTPGHRNDAGRRCYTAKRQGRT